MDGWLDYALTDFLLFSPETYWRLFERMNTALWPLSGLLPVALTGVSVAAARGWQHAGVVVGASLAVCWGIVAFVFLGTHYGAINWAVDWVIPFVWVQAGLLVALAPGLRFDRAGAGRGLAWAAIGAAIGYPVAGLLAGRPFVQSELVGLAPDPTALLTLGLVALAQPMWRVAILSALPSAWLIFSAATLFAMQEPTAWLPVMALVFTLWTFAVRLGQPRP